MAIYCIITTFHEHSTYWRMMADLLTVDWTAVEEDLAGLAENWVEGFVHT